MWRSAKRAPPWARRRCSRRRRNSPRLADAVADCRLVVGTTSVGHRELQHPIRRLEYGARLMLRVLPAAPVALVFGSEKFGLSNDDLSHCHWLMRIPTVGQDLSMNLGQAVALCLYEMARDPKAAAARPEKIRFRHRRRNRADHPAAAGGARQERLREPRHRRLHRRKGAPPGPPPGNPRPRRPRDPGHAAADSLETGGVVRKLRRRFLLPEFLGVDAVLGAASGVLVTEERRPADEVDG